MDTCHVAVNADEYEFPTFHKILSNIWLTKIKHIKHSHSNVFFSIKHLLIQSVLKKGVFKVGKSKMTILKR